MELPKVVQFTCGVHLLNDILGQIDGLFLDIVHFGHSLTERLHIDGHHSAHLFGDQPAEVDPWRP